MKLIVDLHIHSRYARACSQDLTPENIAWWCRKKGITIVGTGDFTHPKWLADLKEVLRETASGLYTLKSGKSSTLFMLTTEVASIYKQGDKVRRVHNLIFAPNFVAVDRLIELLENRGVNLKADGRPIMGVSCSELVKICKAVDEHIEVIPAHVWTPHFGVFGSLSGFDTLEEAFGDMIQYIFAIETGLSSDPSMNWRISGLDTLSLISNSDAHSLRKLGREANMLEVAEEHLSYTEIIRAFKQKNKSEFLQTIEFYPEEGKYHLDGHRDHDFSCTPEQTKNYRGVCPICGKQLLRGVLNRVDQLADRVSGAKPQNAVPFVNTIPLEEIIAQTLGVGVSSKKVTALYEQLTSKQSEFSLLLDLSKAELENIVGPGLAANIVKVRDGDVRIKPGFDGVFGKVELPHYLPEQASLF